MNVDRDKFLTMVGLTMQAHPEWMADTIKVIQAGVLSALDVEKTKRADAETAVVLLVGDFERVKAHQQDIVARVIVNSKAFGGTPFAQQLEEKFGLQKEI